MNWGKKQIEYKFIEVEPGHPQNLEGLEESIQALAVHPGFNALSNRLRLNRSQLQSRLQSTLGATLDEVRFLQAGIYWSGWLEAQIKQLVYKARPVISEPNAEELAIMKEIHESLEVIGGE